MTEAKDNQLINVGLVGLGRSGWSIHARALADLPDQYRIAAATDANSSRRNEAELRYGARTYEDLDQMLLDPQIELIIIATPNHLHGDQSLMCMRSGRHVVVEKPVASSLTEISELIEVSQQQEVVLAPFQNRRYDPHFQKVRSIIESGVLGRIVQIRMAAHNFGRRWDWQTLTEMGGGTLNNAGSHYLDQALELFGSAQPQLFCFLDNVLSLGNADDHAVLILHAPGAPMIQLEMSSACSMPQDFWLVMGDRGTLRGNVDHLEWQTTDVSTLPPRRVQPGEAEGRLYQSEQLTWNKEEWTVPPAQAKIEWTHKQFYIDLYQTLRHGRPLAITPQQVLRQIQILEQAHKGFLASTSSRA